MVRNAMDTLTEWKEKPMRKPLYLTGIKGVGKTYLSFEFAKGQFDSFLYLNLEHNPRFAAELDSLPQERIFPVLAAHFEVPEEFLQNTPLIFDELFVCPNFLRRLTELSVSRNTYWILISSFDALLPEQYPLVQQLCLFPIQFDEFLIATGKKWYVEVITAHCESRRKIPDIVHQELLSTFDEYLWIGGMPDVIQEYLSMESSINVAERQEMHRIQLLHGIGQTADEKIASKCCQVYSTIDEQLKKSNQKFQFRRIRKGTTYQMYQSAIEFLERQSFLYRLRSLTGGEQQFKLFHSEFSFCKTESSEELTDVEQNIRLQNYILQTMNEKGYACSFWESRNRAAIDLVLEEKDCLFPVEAAFGGRLKSKSLQAFRKELSTEYQIGKSIKKCVRFSDSNFIENSEFIHLPVYSAFCYRNRG